MPDVFLVTAAQMPKPDPETHFLAAALKDAGISARLAAWDDRNVDWGSARVVLIRTPWNYATRCTDFLDWAQAVEAQTNLQNPLDVIAWNAHKSYLRDLAEAGVHVLPTQIIPQGTAHIDLSSAPSGEIVVKPAIGVGARGAMRGHRDDPALMAHAVDLAFKFDVLVQPFAASVGVVGEASLIYIAGAFSHAVRKVPAAGDYRVQAHFGGTVHHYTPTAEDFDMAARALNAAPGATTYARVDLVSFEGVPAVMELECIEPELFLGHDESASPKLAAAIQALLA